MRKQPSEAMLNSFQQRLVFDVMCTPHSWAIIQMRSDHWLIKIQQDFWILVLDCPADQSQHAICFGVCFLAVSSQNIGRYQLWFLICEALANTMKGYIAASQWAAAFRLSENITPRSLPRTQLIYSIQYTFQTNWCDYSCQSSSLFYVLQQGPICRGGVGGSTLPMIFFWPPESPSIWAPRGVDSNPSVSVTC